MQIKLTWPKTGDTLLFDVMHHDIAKWFVEQCEKLGNNFEDYHHHFAPDEAQPFIDALTNDVELINPVLNTFKLPMMVLPTDWNDQDELNRLHHDWVNIINNNSKFEIFLSKHNTKLHNSFHRINKNVHLLERSFCYWFQDAVGWKIENPFKDQAYEWHIANLSINFCGFGKCAIEKFVLGNNDIFDEEWSNWDHITPFVQINAVKPYKLGAPVDFILWCKQHNIVPHNVNVPIGNLVDWKNNLTKARQMLRTNRKQEDNYFNFSII